MKYTIILCAITAGLALALAIWCAVSGKWWLVGLNLSTFALQLWFATQNLKCALEREHLRGQQHALEDLKRRLEKK